MEVTLLAQSQMNFHAAIELPHLWDTQFGDRVHRRSSDSSADLLAEIAGRLCYQSWDLPNPATAENAGYLANILDHEHLSVLEHASFTFLLAGVSRILTHELVRHRHLSFSQESGRYVDMSGSDFVTPPLVKNHPSLAAEVAPMEEAMVRESRKLYTFVYDYMCMRGYSRKEARDAARYYLPAGMETDIVVTGNGRAWIETLGKRTSEHAQEEIRLLAGHIKEALKHAAPNTFQEM